jgi:hypothetical protein
VKQAKRAQTPARARRSNATALLPQGDEAAYQARALRLVRRLQQMAPVPGGEAKRGRAHVTRQHAEIAAFAVKLTSLADELDRLTAVTSAIEDAHDRVVDLNFVGAGGSVSTERVPRSFSTFKGAVLEMRQLAESAKIAAGELPDSRQRLDLVFAAEVFLHLRCRHGFPRPSLYDDGPDVQALRKLLQDAGIPLSAARVRGLLSGALKDFDPHLIPDYVDEIL